jgi:hypothetical protein
MMNVYKVLGEGGGDMISRVVSIRKMSRTSEKMYKWYNSYAHAR